MIYCMYMHAGKSLNTFVLYLYIVLRHIDDRILIILVCRILNQLPLPLSHVSPEFQR